MRMLVTVDIDAFRTSSRAVLIFLLNFSAISGVRCIPVTVVIQNTINFQSRIQRKLSHMFCSLTVSVLFLCHLSNPVHVLTG